MANLKQSLESLVKRTAQVVSPKTPKSTQKPQGSK